MLRSEKSLRFVKVLSDSKVTENNTRLREEPCSKHLKNAKSRTKSYHSYRRAGVLLIWDPQVGHCIL
jgi:hypothetical protein